MTLNERNYAGDHVVVGSLEVLGAVKGGNITEIKRNIELIQKQTEFMGRQQEQYWAELSSDGVITPLEKQQLLKEIKSIQNSYTAIYAQALSIGQEASQYVQDYIATYNELYSYLYTSLHLFDDMENNTDIDNRNTFNTKFYNYYYSESFVLVALSKGLLDSVSIRVLSSLLDPGEEGDVGIYHGALYQYVDGIWKNVSTGNYKGALDSLPLAEQDAFFLASDNFVVTTELYVNGEQLQVNDGNGLDALAISRLYRKGYIYYCQNGAWFEQGDKTNYMYVAAFADVLNVTGELPQIFQDAIDNLQTQIDANKVPAYRGPSATNPADPVEGDYFVYSGTTTVTRRNSDIYQYQNGDWVRLDPTDSKNSTYYMQALDDILLLNNANDGYFAALFAQALFANNAFLYALTTKILTLRGPDGYFQSDNWSQESSGFRLAYNGDADLNGNTHIAGKVAIGAALQNNSDFNTYDVVMGGKLKIGGNTVAAGFEIAGVEPAYGGDSYLLFNFNTNNTGYCWEICGSGRVACVGSFTGSLVITIWRNNSIIWEKKYFKGNSSNKYIVDDEERSYDYYYPSGMLQFEMSIQAGDLIIIDSKYRDEGAAITTFYIPGGSANIGLYTKYPCGILRYLGKKEEFPASYHPTL